MNKVFSISTFKAPILKNTYYNVRRVVGLDSRRIDVGTPAAELLRAAVTQYARLHNLTAAPLFRAFAAFFVSSGTRSSGFWSLAYKEARVHGFVPTHAVYNYGMTAQAACQYVADHDFARGFGDWLCVNGARLDHSLFDLSFDFRVNGTGDGLAIVRSALGGGALA